MTPIDQPAVPATLNGSCNIWQGSTNATGYPVKYVNGKRRHVLRVNWEEVHGALPANYVLHRQCGNRLCVEPLHAEKMTKAAARRIDSPIIRGLAARTHCARGGHPLSGENLAIYGGSRICRQCAREAGASYDRRVTAERQARRSSFRPVVPQDLAGENWPIDQQPHLTQKIFDVIRVDSITGCWLAMTQQNERGYAYLRVDGKLRRLHRLVWELTRGSIPQGLVLDHVYARGCRHRNCVNPAHLEPVTQQENVRRGLEVSR